MANGSKQGGVTRRRLFRKAGVAGATLSAAPAFISGAHADAHHMDSELFPLGVFSGEPDSFSVVIGTRVAPDPLNGGGLGTPRALVDWVVAHDKGSRTWCAAGGPGRCRGAAVPCRLW